jgi:hypothetical protein
MREDALKVFTEKGKYPCKWYKNKPVHLKDKRSKEDNLPFQESMRKHLYHHYWSRKDSDFYYKNLIGILNKNIGNSWDAIYSDIRKVVSAKTASGITFLNILKGMIEFDCFSDKEDGLIYPLMSFDSKSPLKPLVSNARCFTYYIHPESKTLEVAPFQIFNSVSKEIELIVFPHNKWLQYRKVTKSLWKESKRSYIKKTDWYAFTLSKKPEMVQRTINQLAKDPNGVTVCLGSKIVWEYPNQEKDVLLGERLEKVDESKLKLLYKDPTLYASKKKLLNSRELILVRKTLEFSQ